MTDSSGENKKYYVKFENPRKKGDTMYVIMSKHSMNQQAGKEQIIIKKEYDKHNKN